MIQEAIERNGYAVNAEVVDSFQQPIEPRGLMLIESLSPTAREAYDVLTDGGVAFANRGGKLFNLGVFDAKLNAAGQEGYPIHLDGLITDFAAVGTEYYQRLVDHDPTIQRDIQDESLPPIITRTGIEKGARYAYERVYVIQPGHLAEKRDLLIQEHPGMIGLLAVLQTTINQHDSQNGTTHPTMKAIATAALSEELVTTIMTEVTTEENLAQPQQIEEIVLDTAIQTSSPHDKIIQPETRKVTQEQEEETTKQEKGQESDILPVLGTPQTTDEETKEEMREEQPEQEKTPEETNIYTHPTTPYLVTQPVTPTTKTDAIENRDEEARPERKRPKKAGGTVYQRKKPTTTAEKKPSKAERQKAREEQQRQRTIARLSRGIDEEALTDGVQALLRDITQYPMITAQREKELGQIIERGRAEGASREQVQDAEQAIKEFEQANFRLVFSIAKKNIGDWHTHSLLDLFQEGYFGLKKAVLKYDWRRGYKFSSMATNWIRQAMTRSIPESGMRIKEPVQAYGKINKVNRIARKLESEGVTATPEAIAESMQDTPETVRTYQQLERQRHIASLDAPLDDEEDKTLGDTLAEQTQSPSKHITLTDEQREQLFAPLTPRERLILDLYFGKQGTPGIPLQAVGIELGITRERVRQIIAAALPKILHKAQTLELDVFLQ